MADRLVVESDCPGMDADGECVGCDRGRLRRRAGPADIVAHLRALPHADRVALLVAQLRAEPDAAVEAVDSCKVARPRSHRASEVRLSLANAIAWGPEGGGDDHLLAGGWVLATGSRS